MNPSCHQSGEKIRVLLISSVRPEPTSGGQIVLHRHLCEEPRIELIVHDYEPGIWTANGIIRRLFGCLSRMGFDRIAQDFWALWKGRWLDRSLFGIDVDDRTVALTVAQGDSFPAAARFAKSRGIPLVSIFHDWWPDMSPVHAPFKSLLEQSFRDLYRESQLALCVSDGMRAALGSHPNARVLYPIPDKISEPVSSPQRLHEFKVLYFGNLHEYGPMLAKALEAMRGHSLIRLETRGFCPAWSESFRLGMEREGLWHDFAPRDVLTKWLSSADAFLVPMVFEPAMKRRMETSFPSKMVEMCQMGKPIVVWGPESCSAIRWARDGGGALCVTDPDPKALVRELEKLAATPDERRRLSECSRTAAAGDFSPAVIQDEFLVAIEYLLKKSPTNNTKSCK